MSSNFGQSYQSFKVSSEELGFKQDIIQHNSCVNVCLQDVPLNSRVQESFIIIEQNYGDFYYVLPNMPPLSPIYPASTKEEELSFAYQNSCFNFLKYRLAVQYGMDYYLSCLPETERISVAPKCNRFNLSQISSYAQTIFRLHNDTPKSVISSVYSFLQQVTASTSFANEQEISLEKHSSAKTYEHAQHGVNQVKSQETIGFSQATLYDNYSFKFTQYDNLQSSHAISSVPNFKDQAESKTIQVKEDFNNREADAPQDINPAKHVEVAKSKQVVSATSVGSTTEKQSLTSRPVTQEIQGVCTFQEQQEPQPQQIQQAQDSVYKSIDSALDNQKVSSSYFNQAQANKVETKRAKKTMSRAGHFVCVMLLVFFSLFPSIFITDIVDERKLNMSFYTWPVESFSASAMKIAPVAVHFAAERRLFPLEQDKNKDHTKHNYDRVSYLDFYRAPTDSITDIVLVVSDFGYWPFKQFYFDTLVKQKLKFQFSELMAKIPFVPNEEKQYIEHFPTFLITLNEPKAIYDLKVKVNGQEQSLPSFSARFMDSVVLPFTQAKTKVINEQNRRGIIDQEVELELSYRFRGILGFSFYPLGQNGILNLKIITNEELPQKFISNGISPTSYAKTSLANVLAMKDKHKQSNNQPSLGQNHSSSIQNKFETHSLISQEDLSSFVQDAFKDIMIRNPDVDYGKEASWQDKQDNKNNIIFAQTQEKNQKEDFIYNAQQKLVDKDSSGIATANSAQNDFDVIAQNSNTKSFAPALAEELLSAQVLNFQYAFNFKPINPKNEFDFIYLNQDPNIMAAIFQDFAHMRADLTDEHRITLNFKQGYEAYDQIYNISKYTILQILFILVLLMAIAFSRGVLLDPLQYALASFLILLGQLLLLSLSEFMHFTIAYICSIAIISSMLTCYVLYIFKTIKYAIMIFISHVAISLMTFSLVSYSEYTLIISTALLVIILACIMFITRRINQNREVA